MRVAFETHKRVSELPRIIVIDARQLAAAARLSSQTASSEEVVVVFAKPTVRAAFGNFYRSAVMLGRVLMRSLNNYFATVNRGHVNRLRNL